VNAGDALQFALWQLQNQMSIPDGKDYSTLANSFVALADQAGGERIHGHRRRPGLESGQRGRDRCSGSTDDAPGAVIVRAAGFGRVRALRRSSACWRDSSLRTRLSESTLAEVWRSLKSERKMGDRPASRAGSDRLRYRATRRRAGSSAPSAPRHHLRESDADRKISYIPASQCP